MNHASWVLISVLGNMIIEYSTCGFCVIILHTHTRLCMDVVSYDIGVLFSWNLSFEYLLGYEFLLF